MAAAPLTTTTNTSAGLVHRMAITDEDRTHLARIGSRLGTSLPRIVTELHERLAEQVGREGFPVSAEDSNRLEARLTDWLEQLVGWMADESRIVATPTTELALSPRHVLIALSVLRVGFERELDDVVPSEARLVRGALARLLDAELLAVLDAYDVAQAEQQQGLRLESARILAAGVAHELRNPLNGALLHLALLDRTLATTELKEARKDVRVADLELRRAAAVVKELATFAKAPAFAAVPIDLAALCERVVDGLERPAGVTLTTQLPNLPIVVDGDPPRLERVVLHLLENAIDAVRERGGNIVIRVREDGTHTAVEIEDDGPGLADPGAPIFDAFYSSRTGRRGLGLAIVHHIASLHGGHVDVRRRSGLTCSRVRLPRR